MKKLILCLIITFMSMACAAKQTQQPDARLYVSLLDQIEQQKKEIEKLMIAIGRLQEDSDKLQKLAVFAINEDSTRTVLKRAKELGLLRAQRPAPTPTINKKLD